MDLDNEMISKDTTSQGIVDAIKIVIPMLNGLLEQAAELGIKLSFRVRQSNPGDLSYYETKEMSNIRLKDAKQSRGLKT